MKVLVIEEPGVLLGWKLKKKFGSDSQKIEELSAKIEMLMKRDQKSVHFVGDQSNQANQELAANDSDDQADMNLIGGQGNNNKGFNQNFKSQNQQNLLSCYFTYLI